MGDLGAWADAPMSMGSGGGWSPLATEELHEEYSSFNSDQLGSTPYRLSEDGRLVMAHMAPVPPGGARPAKSAAHRPSGDGRQLLESLPPHLGVSFNSGAGSDGALHSGDLGAQPRAGAATSGGPSRGSATNLANLAASAARPSSTSAISSGRAGHAAPRNPPQLASLSAASAAVPPAPAHPNPAGAQRPTAPKATYGSLSPGSMSATLPDAMLASLGALSLQNLQDTHTVHTFLSDTGLGVLQGFDGGSDPVADALYPFSPLQNFQYSDPFAHNLSSSPQSKLQVPGNMRGMTGLASLPHEMLLSLMATNGGSTDYGNAGRGLQGSGGSYDGAGLAALGVGGPMHHSQRPASGPLASSTSANNNAGGGAKSNNNSDGSGLTNALAHVQAAAASAPPSTSLYVKNLPPEADELLLYRTFAHIGPLLSAKVHTDPVTGRCKGVGFVNFADHASALSALQQLHGARIADGRVLHVTLQAPRAVRAASAKAVAQVLANANPSPRPQAAEPPGGPRQSSMGTAAGMRSISNAGIGLMMHGDARGSPYAHPVPGAPGRF